MVDVDGVLFYSPVIDLICILPPTRGPLLRLAMKLYQSRIVRRMVSRLLRLNPHAVAYIMLRVKQGYTVIYCTGRTASAIQELVGELVKRGVPFHGVVSRAYEPVDNPTLKLVAVLALKRMGLRVVEVYDDSCAICRLLVVASPCTCGKAFTFS